MRSEFTGAQTIESDSYDRAVIARLRAGSEAWRRLDLEGARLLPFFPALLDDLFCALFKLNVLPAAGAPAPGAELAARIVQGVRASEGYAALRMHTVLDETAAGLGAVSIGESVLRALREERTLTSGDLLDLWNLQQKDERAREAEEASEVADELAREADERRPGEEADAAEGDPDEPAAAASARRGTGVPGRS